MSWSSAETVVKAGTTFRPRFDGVFLEEHEFKQMVAVDELYELLKSDMARLEVDFFELAALKEGECDLLTKPKIGWFTFGILSGVVLAFAARN